MNKTVVIILGIILVLVGGFYAFNNFIYQQKQAPAVDPSINTYEKCADAGYPILDSYPEQCVTPDGKRFVRNVPESEKENVTSEITIQGKVVCLPHWDTSGEQTLECAFGLQTDEGDYYALNDTDPNYGNLSGPTGERVEVVGKLIPGSSERYQGLGTIEVEELKRID